jgi:hypothetical protein
MAVAGRADHQAGLDDRRRTNGLAGEVHQLLDVTVAKAALQPQQRRAGPVQPSTARPDQRRRVRLRAQPAAHV